MGNKRKKELLVNTIILSLGKFLPKLIAIITLPIVTGYLTKREYGSYDLITTLVMLIMPIATLQVQSAAFRFLIDCKDDENEQKKIISNIFIITIPVSLIVCIILIFIFKDFSVINRITIVSYLFFDIFNLTLCQIARGLSKNKIYSISSILLSAINCLGTIILVKFFSLGFFGVTFSLCIANVISVIFLSYILKLKRYIDIKAVSKQQIKEMIYYSWPMIPNNLSNWVLRLSDRMVITFFLGVEANAIYAVANKIPNLLSMAQSVFVMAWQENASIAVKDKDSSSYYSEMFDLVYCLVIGITAVLIAFTPLIFKLLIKGNYNEAYYQMPILIIGMLFYCMSAFQGGIYIAHKKTKSVGITTMVAALINLIVDFLLVRKIGITAGSVSTLIAYFMLYIYRMIDCTKFQKINYNIPKQIFCLIIIIVMALICWLNSFMLNIINIPLGIMACVILNYKIIIMIPKKLLKNRSAK